jgi:hypothetical protein
VGLRRAGSKGRGLKRPGKRGRGRQRRGAEAGRAGMSGGEQEVGAGNQRGGWAGRGSGDSAAQWRIMMASRWL